MHVELPAGLPWHMDPVQEAAKAQRAGPTPVVQLEVGDSDDLWVLAHAERDSVILAELLRYV